MLILFESGAAENSAIWKQFRSNLEAMESFRPNTINWEGVVLERNSSEGAIKRALTGPDGYAIHLRRIGLII